MTDRDIEVLNALITASVDSADGFEQAAVHEDATRFSPLFGAFAQERRQVVSALQAAVRACGGAAQDDGPLPPTLQRRWLDLRDAISGGGDKDILEEVERGEDHLKVQFEQALRLGLIGHAARQTIEVAYESVRTCHDKAMALKHRMRATTH